MVDWQVQTSQSSLTLIAEQVWRQIMEVSLEFVNCQLFLYLLGQLLRTFNPIIFVYVRRDRQFQKRTFRCRYLRRNQRTVTIVKPVLVCFVRSCIVHKIARHLCIVHATTEIASLPAIPANKEQYFGEGSTNRKSICTGQAV